MDTIERTCPLNGKVYKLRKITESERIDAMVEFFFEIGVTSLFELHHLRNTIRTNLETGAATQADKLKLAKIMQAENNQNKRLVKLSLVEPVIADELLVFGTPLFDWLMGEIITLNEVIETEKKTT